MAINKNHEFEELDGVKCGIVEKNVSPERLAFLKPLLELNGFTVVAVPSPAPKAAPPPKVAEGETAPPPPPPPPPPSATPVHFYSRRHRLYLQYYQCDFRTDAEDQKRACGDPGILAAERSRKP